MTAVRCLAVAAAYLLLGKLALLLAIPPGYATAVWPAAGVALVVMIVGDARLAVGLWLGSFLVNADLGSARSLAIAAVVAAGATVQAAAGAALVRRRVPWPSPLEDPRDTLALLLRGGPVACVISATTGVTTLYVAGEIAAGDAAFSWLTWWVGDTIGCVLLAPLLLLLINRPRPPHRRLIAVALPLVIGFALVTVLYVVISGWERRRQHDAFARRAAPVHATIERQLHDHENMVIAVTALFAASDEVSRDDFAAFATPLLRRSPALLGLTWNPVVEAGQRTAFEQAVRASGVAGFAIAERDAGGAPVPAAARPRYVPILYFEPSSAGAPALGFDVSSEARRRDALARAVASAAPAATATVELLQSLDDRRAVVLYAAHHRDGVLRGYASGVLQIGAIVDAALASTGSTGLALSMRDLSSPVASPLHGLDPGADAWRRDTIHFGGRAWQLALWPVAGAPETARSWVSWTVLATGLILVALLGALTLVTTGRAAQIERAVRTQQLLLGLSESATLTVEVEELQLEVATRLGEHLDANRCVFHVIDVAADRAEVRHDFHVGVPSLAGSTYQPSSFSPETQADLRAGRTVVNHDALTDPRTRDRYHTVYEPLDIRSYVVVPLFRDGVWSASLWVARTRPQPWTADELALITDVAEKAWTWMERMRLGSELRALNRNLERIIAERTRHLDAAVREREVLLREIHHRVKNNLQVISSLLGLQSHNVADGVARAALQESRTRVLAIAQVHEHLYQTADLAAVGFDGYAQALATNLLATYGGAGRGIRVEVQAGGVRLPVNQAIPCGLILGELVSNALRHAFPGERGGVIEIGLREQPDGVLRLTVRDDGVGLPADLDLRRLPSLGVELVFAFAEQLAARVEVTRAPGTCFTIEFARAP